MTITDYHAKYFAHELTKRCASDSMEKLAGTVAGAQVDLNPHQVDAALFAFDSPLSKGALLADEVGLGKTIEAGLVVSQKWAERKRRILVIVPSNLRKQWYQELNEKFFLPCAILETKSYNAAVKVGNLRPFEANDAIVICSYQFARNKAADVANTAWDLVVMDEAHRLRNVYKPSNVIANTLKLALARPSSKRSPSPSPRPANWALLRRPSSSPNRAGRRTTCSASWPTASSTTGSSCSTAPTPTTGRSSSTPHGGTSTPAPTDHPSPTDMFSQNPPPQLGSTCQLPERRPKVIRFPVRLAFLAAGLGCLLIAQAAHPPAEPADKLRVVVLTDISNEPDDQQSLVRFLTYANEFDVEGLIASTSCWRRNNPDKPTILQVLDAYEKALPNLRKHAAGYPDANALRRVTKAGVDGYGMSAAAEQLDNEGVQLIVSVLERADPRPVWFCAWGGGNTLGGAVMKLQRERPQDAAPLVEKIRGYEIALQDDGFAYIAHHFPDTKLISARLLWRGISRTTPNFNVWSESWGGNNEVFNADWVRQHVQRDHGPLGEQYPDAVYLWEGDTPSFLHLLPNGLSDPEQPHWGSWGGRFEPKRQENVRSGTGNDTVDPLLDEHRDYFVYSDARDRWSYRGTNYHSEFATVFRWREAFQNDFAARMDWCVADDFKQANHNPVAVLNGDRTKQVIRLTAQPGATVTLSADGTHDPDGDTFEVSWWIYPETGTLPTNAEGKSPVTLSVGQGSRTSLVTPKVGKPETLHVILEVRDAGTPPLWAYRRAVITVEP